MMVTSEAEGVIVIWFMGVNSPGDDSLPKRRRAICSASEDGLTRFDAVEHLTGQILADCAKKVYWTSAAPTCLNREQIPFIWPGEGDRQAGRCATAEIALPLQIGRTSVRRILQNTIRQTRPAR